MPPNSSLLSNDVQDKLQTNGKLLDDLQKVQNMRLSQRPEGPGGPTPEGAIRPSAQEKIIGENFRIPRLFLRLGFHQRPKRKHKQHTQDHQLVVNLVSFRCSNKNEIFVCKWQCYALSSHFHLFLVQGDLGRRHSYCIQFSLGFF